MISLGAFLGRLESSNEFAARKFVMDKKGWQQRRADTDHRRSLDGGTLIEIHRLSRSTLYALGI